MLGDWYEGLVAVMRRGTTGRRRSIYQSWLLICNHVQQIPRMSEATSSLTDDAINHVLTPRPHVGVSNSPSPTELGATLGSAYTGIYSRATSRRLNVSSILPSIHISRRRANQPMQ